ncbi:hypothetical protein EVB71_009 [Rhizobium phage RHph_Y55]|nr:hypothetical protein EVB71_009 [Rhizobium phage RHph_Y55]
MQNKPIRGINNHRTRNTAMFNFAYFIDGVRMGMVKAENKAQALELARKDAERKGLDASKVSLNRN